MKGAYFYERANDIEVTLTVTMTVHEWKLVNEQLAARWPSWKLSKLIADMTSKVDSVVALPHEVDL